MSRPGFVLEVDERTPPTLFHHGEGFRLEKLPLGTRVVYGPDPIPGLRDVDAAIGSALQNPRGSEPLGALLRPGMKLTIAVDDISLPLPPMRTPDIRGRVIEHVLDANLTDSVCTFIGHPRVCPHGKPIPTGACCRSLSRPYPVMATSTAFWRAGCWRSRFATSKPFSPGKPMSSSATFGR